MTCSLLSVRREGEERRVRGREKKRESGMEEGGGIKKERGRITQYIKRGTCTYNIKEILTCL